MKLNWIKLAVNLAALGLCGLSGGLSLLAVLGDKNGFISQGVLCLFSLMVCMFLLGVTWLVNTCIDCLVTWNVQRELEKYYPMEECGPTLHTGSAQRPVRRS